MIIGIMWNCNEGDILEETIASAVTKVDSLFIADDNSTDNSWNIIQSAAKRYDNIEYIRNKREHPKDVGQRQSLLNEIRKRYRPEDTWVQTIESDIMVLDTDVRQAIDQWAVQDIGVSWQLLNAVRKKGTWTEVDTYPVWDKPITEIMPYAHRLEVMLYTYRPLPKLYFDLDMWRPWPRGFNHYTEGPLTINKRSLEAPLLAHYGYRGPTHFFKKFSKRGQTRHRKYRSWDMSSIESIDNTVFFFNGQWNNEEIFDMSREGWRKHRKG